MANRHDRDQQWAIFWCSLFAPLIYGEIPPEEAGRLLSELAARDHLFPDGQRRKLSRATLWRRWKQYREGGFEALFPKRRKDRGKPRKAQPMIQRAIELKQDQPRRSEETINQFLEREFRQKLPKSTLYRHLKHAGATRRKLGISREKVRRRWSRDDSNALWVGDFEDGPYVMEGAITHSGENSRGKVQNVVIDSSVVRFARLGKECGQRRPPNAVHRGYHKSRPTQDLEVGRVC